MPKESWQPTWQEIELISDMLAAKKPKSAIARFLYIPDGRLWRWLAKVENERHYAERRARQHNQQHNGLARPEGAA